MLGRRAAPVWLSFPRAVGTPASFMPYHPPSCQEAHSRDGLSYLVADRHSHRQLPEGLLRPVHLSQERHRIER